MKKTCLLFLLILPIFAYSQNEDDAREFANSITMKDLFDHLSIVASDAFEGRETGTRGQKVAAAYIKAHFESLGLSAPVKSEYGNGYYQRVPLYTTKPGETYLSLGDIKVQNMGGMIYRGSANTEKEVTLEIVFAGAGTDEELEGLDIKGKGVMVITDSYRTVLRGISRKLSEAGAVMTFALATETEEQWSELIGIYSGRSSRLSVDKPELSADLSGGVVFVNKATAESMFGSVDNLKKTMATAQSGKKDAFKKIKNMTVSLKSTVLIDQVDSENVLGYMEGTDKKDELVILTAHYDHIGRNGATINNGADDDGSGTVTILELAEAFVKAKEMGKGPRRSILFMTVTGEEKGLLGSDYYTKHPVFPLESTVVNLNVDMIGRVDPQHKEKRDYVYLVGSDRLSSELHQISEKVNDTFTSMDLDYTYNNESHPDRIYYRSDHWNFAKNNIPIIFYFNGVHEDYHRSTDTVDKIEFDMLQKRAQLVFYTAWVLSNREDRIIVDKVEGTKVEIK